MPELDQAAHELDHGVNELDAAMPELGYPVPKAGDRTPKLSSRSEHAAHHENNRGARPYTVTVAECEPGAPGHNALSVETLLTLYEGMLEFSEFA